MLEIIAFLCLAGALVFLCVLSLIDLKHGLLPNELVFGFLCLGIIFHLCTLFTYLSVTDMVLGGFMGGGILYLIRAIAMRFYGADALGLGDVKLLAAAGLWLGPYYILIAMTLGALAGIAHGLGMALYYRKKNKMKVDLAGLSLPAGPGFAVGTVIAAVTKFHDLPGLLMP